MLCLVVQLISRKQFQHHRRRLFQGCLKKKSCKKLLSRRSGVKTMKRQLGGQLNPGQGWFMPHQTDMTSSTAGCRRVCPHACDGESPSFLFTCPHGVYQGLFMPSPLIYYSFSLYRRAARTDGAFTHSHSPLWAARGFFSSSSSFLFCCIFKRVQFKR